MPPEVEADVDAGAPPAGDGVDDPSGSTPETDESEYEAAEVEPGDDGEGEAEADAGEGDETIHAADDEGDDEDPEYRNLVNRFKHITNPRDRRAAMGRAYWESKNFNSKLNKQNEDLRLENARLKEAQPKKDEPPPPPPPELAKVIQKVETLFNKGKALEARRSEVVTELNAADRALAVAQDRLKDVEGDEERRPLAEARVRQAEFALNFAREKFGSVMERQELNDERIEQALSEKDWIERFQKDQQSRRADAQKRTESFNSEFPQQVMGLTEAAMHSVKLNLSEGQLGSLHRHVNRALQADIRGQYLETDIEDIPVPELVMSYVKEWAEDHDLAKRRTFSENSREKLRVASRATIPGGRRTPGAVSKPVPASSRPPVPPALLSRDSTPSMAKARRLLVQRLGGG